ncbi:MAG: hypothetical protein V4648_03245 [Bacteroidota bacterium]
MTKKQLLLTVFVIAFLFYVDPIYAGPGGYIAKGLFKSFWGKILLFVLAIVFLPLLIYIRLIEWRKERKIKKLLNQLGTKHKEFGWLQLNKEFSNIIRRVYNAWSNENMGEVQGYVNHWYWQNQQKVFLDQWKRENVKNVSRLKDITKIRPLYLELTNAPNFEGTRIAIAIDIEAEDYLKDLETGKITQGKEGFQDLEYLWFLEYTEGKWLLDDIQEGSLSLQIAKTKDVIPEGIVGMVRV